MKNYDGAIGGLDNMNALLDEEHRITVDSIQYNEKLSSEKHYQCNFCTVMEEFVINPGEEEEIREKRKVQTEISYADIHIFAMTLDFMDSVMSSKKSKKAWFCPKCKNINLLSDTVIITSERANPSYIGIVSDRPVQTSTNRVGFHKKFMDYFNNYSKELENALMLYRINYIKENGEDMAEQQFRDKGD